MNAEDDNGGDSPMPDATDDPTEETLPVSVRNSLPPASSSHASNVPAGDASHDPPDGYPDTDMEDMPPSDISDSSSDTAHHPPANTSAAALPPPHPSTSAPQMKEPWVSIVEDDSTAAEDELARIVSAGEHSALDEAYWRSKHLKDLNDADLQQSATGRLQLVMSPFNGTHEKPNRDLLVRSDPVQVGKHWWRLKIYPKGNGTTYLAAYLECLTFSPDKDKDPKLVGPALTVTDTPLPLLDGATTREYAALIPVQMVLIMYNPNEPRVHYSKPACHSFASGDSDRGFNRFGSNPISQLGRRMPDSRQALLRHDTLGFIAYFHVYDDPTGYLFSQTPGFDRLKDFTRTGLWPLRDLRDNEGVATSLSAATILLIFLPQVRTLLYRAGDFVETEKPLTHALLHLICNMRRPQSEQVEHLVSLRQVADALQWDGIKDVSPACQSATCVRKSAKVVRLPLVPWHPHGASMEHLDIFQVLEIMKAQLTKELSELGAADVFKAQYGARGFRTTLIKGSTHIRKGLSSKSLRSDSNEYPPVLQIQLPRTSYDTGAHSWKKLNDRIPSPENLRLTPDGSSWYTLYGIVTHNDSEPCARSYTAIVRPDGRHWVKFLRQGVGRVTRKQALRDNEASACISVYMRNDIAAKQLVSSSPLFEGFPEDRWTVPEKYRQASPRTSHGDGYYSDDESSHDGSASSYDSSGAPRVATDSAGASAKTGESTSVRVTQDTPCTCSTPSLQEQQEPAVSDEIFEVESQTNGYYRGRLHLGHFQGKGRLINKKGDAYDGMFDKGLRSGHGKQVYANGDVYEGGWSGDKMHGQGVYKTKLNGHVYTGGFEDGQRKGPFTIKGDQAEGLPQCLICYEAPRNTVFVPCGHIAGCSTCCKRLRTCPYCNKMISTPIVIHMV